MTHDRPRRLVRRYPIWSFFVLAYLISWAGWIPYVLSVDGLGVLDFQFPLILGETQYAGLLPGAYLGPLAAAFIVTALTEGRHGLRHWRHRLLAWRVGWRWYAVVLLGTPCVLLAGVLLVAGGEQSGGGAGWGILWTYLAMLMLQVLTSGLAEEPGWRDFALTRLQQRHSPIVATGILAPLWAGWHLPLFLTSWAARLNLAVFVLFTLLLSIVITWVYNGSRQSLPLIILLHANVNASAGVLVGGFFPSLGRSAESGLAMSIGLGIAAVVVLLLTRGRLGYHGAAHEEASRLPATVPARPPTAASTRRPATPGNREDHDLRLED